MPGSPPTRTMEPGTTPPPRTKSSSRRPLVQRVSLRATTSRSRGAGATLPPSANPEAPELRRREAADLPVLFTATSSTRVFQAPHTSQRPAHFACSDPHSVQRYTLRACARIGAASPPQRSARHALEKRVLPVEEEIRGTDRTISLLENDHPGHSIEGIAVLVTGNAVLPAFGIYLRPVQRHDEVCVLLDGSRLTKVRHLRTLLVTRTLDRKSTRLNSSHVKISY